MPIKITPHKTLNYSKGVIRSPELKGSSEEEMVSELKDQGVTDIPDPEESGQSRVMPTLPISLRVLITSPKTIKI